MDYFTKDLREDEKLVSSIRQKWTTFILPVLASLILIVLPFFFLPLLSRRGIWNMLLFAFLVFLGIIFALRSVLAWYGNCLLVTDQRLVIFRREGLFKQSLFKLNYDEIETVSSEIRGPVQTILGYGDIKIHLGPGREPVKFIRINDPQRIQELIIRLKEEYHRPKEEFERQLSTYQLTELARKIKQKLGKEAFKEVLEEDEELEGEL